MALDFDLKDLFAQSLTIAPWSSRDVNQKPTYGAAVTFQARIELGTRLIRTADGRTIQTSGRALLVPDSGGYLPSVKDQLTLPASFVVRTPPMLDVKHEPDTDGTDYYVAVYF